MRPGPIQGGAINPYIERRQRLREDPAYEIPYEHPSLEPVLAETLGTIIFQDQVMQVAEAFAGFAPGEAEGLRRAMSRKRSHEMLQGHRTNASSRGRCRTPARRAPDRATAERVWRMIEGFAGFGFPKAHSAAFGLLAYQSTWLRVHYGAEFLCALLNEQPMGFYAPDSLVHEAENRGIVVLGLDVNASGVQCAVAGRRRAPGARLHQGRGRQRKCRRWSAERERNGPFASLGELAARVALRRGALEQLAWSGACDSLLDGHGTQSGRRAPRARQQQQALGAVAAGGGGVGRDRLAARAPARARTRSGGGHPAGAAAGAAGGAAAAQARALAAADRRLLHQRRDGRRPRAWRSCAGG